MTGEVQKFPPPSLSKDAKKPKVGITVPFHFLDEKVKQLGEPDTAYHQDSRSKALIPSSGVNRVHQASWGRGVCAAQAGRKGPKQSETYIVEFGVRGGTESLDDLNFRIH